MLALVADGLFIRTNHASLRRKVTCNDCLDHRPDLRCLGWTPRYKIVNIFNLGKGFHRVVELGNMDLALGHLVGRLRYDLVRVVNRRGFQVNIIKDGLAVIEVGKTRDAAFTGT